MSTAHDPVWLDKMYNNRALVPAYAEHFARWRDLSQTTRAQSRCFLDIAYGTGPNETLDIFPAAHTQGPAPVLVFIHGGYWRSLDKADHSFIAPSFTAQGAHVVVPNYALCPAVTIPQITLQMVKALAWVWRNIERFGGDPARIVVAGHSAGGHLAAMMLACQWSVYAPDLPANLVPKAYSISGLYELDFIRHTPFLQDLQLSEADARRASPAWMPAPAQGVLYTVAGGAESAEFLRHNHLIQQAWGKKRVPVCEAPAGLNHFSIVEAFAQPGHRLHQLGLDLLA
jgi:arylformamidase